MFPSAGYFRSASCPFYVHGLCHRPYCHFKHAKPVKDHVLATTSRGKVYDPPARNDVEKADNKEGERELELKSGSLNVSESASPESFAHDVKDVLSENDEDEVKPQLTDITALLRTSGEPYIECEGEEISVEPIDTNDDSDTKLIEKKVKARKKEVSRKKKLSTKMSDVDFFSSRTPKMNSNKSVKTSTGKGMKRKNSETKEETKLVSAKESCSKNDPLKEGKDSNYKVANSLRARSSSAQGEIATKGKTSITKASSPNTASKDGAISLKRTLSGIVDYIPESCIETTGHGSVKKRIAHANDIEHAQRTISTGQPARLLPKKPSFVSPILSGGPSQHSPESTDHQIQQETKKSEEKTPLYSSEEGLYLGKKRLAHPTNFYKKDANKSSLKRPKIPIEYGAKVPQNIRQRYLDKLIDELLPKCTEEQEAFDKALEEEAVIYQRSSRRQIYMNLCVNAIKRIRDLPPPTEESLPSPVKNDPLTTAGTTTHTVPKTGKPANGKLCIRPSAPSLVVAAKKHSSLLQVKQAQGVNRKIPQGPPTLTEELFYEQLLGYLATEDDLWENNYPRSLPDQPGIAQIKRKSKEPNETETKRICNRCGKQFFMDEEGEYVTTEECHYHWGKIRKVRGRGEISMHFSCCQGEAGSFGCCACKRHVSDFTKVPSGYVTTDDSTLSTEDRGVFSLDCEMCYTSRGLELTRVSVVNFDLKEVYDTFVKPDRPIIDYNTRFSGVTEMHLRDVKVTLKDVQTDLLKMFGKGTILMGHSLESDLKALKIIHNKVVDTALVFPHKMGLPYKRALRNLMAEHLKKIIQDSEGGHDSAEDSSACMELMRWRVVEDIQKKTRTKHY